MRLATLQRAKTLAVTLAALAAAVGLDAQPTVSIVGATQTQAVALIRYASGNCTIQASESASYSPLVPDVDPSLYAGANVDATRPDTINWADGDRIVTIGHQTDDRALAAATTYYLQVSACGGTATAQFTTATLGTGSTLDWPVPFNASKRGNVGYPTIDLLNPKTYVDPLTGVKMRPLNLARHWSFRYGGSFGVTSESQAGGTVSFDDWAGGSGWSNPSTITSGASSSATTSGTSPIDLYMSLWNPWRGYQSLDDVGVVLYGGATSATDADRQVQMCIFTNPTSGCIGTPITVTLPQGSVQQIASSGTDPDHPFPASFPSPLFAGWGISGPIAAEYRNTSGTLSASSGNLSISSLDWMQHFSDGHTAGNRIKMPGSGCQPNDMCTVAAFNNAGSVRIAENITGSFNYIGYGMGIRIWKSNANGQATVGARYKFAGSRATGVQAGTFVCGYVRVTAGDGKQGYVCDVTSPITGTDWLYFVADDGTSRRFSILAVPNHQQQIQNMPIGDRPPPGGNVPSYPTGFDPNDGTLFYAASKNNSGGWSIYKLQYTGDFTQDLDYNYLAGFGGDTPDAYPPAEDNMLWSNLMPPSQNMDLQSQITAKYPNYLSAVYGNWNTGNVIFTGISGGKAFFSNVYSGQDGGPAWVAVVDLPSGVVSNLIHTADGTGTGGYVRWGALHSAQAEPAVPNTLFLADNVLNTQDTSRVHGGPFQAQITGVSRGGSWSSDTSLVWPPDTSYDTTCPAGNAYVFMGAIADQCVTLRFPQGGVCNTYPASVELARWPCPWNSSYAQPFPLTVGAIFGVASEGSDNEKFRIVSISTEPDNQLRIVAQRNAMWDYCCVTGTHQNGGVSNCVDQTSQNVHGGGWSARMYPPNLNGCASGTFVYNMSNNQIGEISRLLGGHGTIAAGITPGKLSLATGVGIKPDGSFTDLFSLPTTVTPLPAPSFQGTVLPIGTNLAQSYPVRVDNGITADPNALPWLLDTNAFNPSQALPPESTINSIGNRTLTAAGTDIYKIQVLGTLSYKTFPLLGWAGRNTLRDVSAPGSALSSAPYYSVCHAYNAGECVSGSSANDVFVKVPNAWDNGDCLTALSWANAPCVVSGLPSGGGARQQSIVRPGQAGSGSRFLSYLMGHPGQHSTFIALQGLTDGKTAIVPGAHNVAGWGPIGWVVQLPPWKEDSVTRNANESVDVQVPSGLAYAEVQFGYSRYGAPNQFYCTPRAEACNTSSSAGTPFNFEGETRSLKSCASGCKIAIPAVAGNVVYFRIRRSSDGVNWTNGSTEALALP